MLSAALMMVTQIFLWVCRRVIKCAKWKCVIILKCANKIYLLTAHFYSAIFEISKTKERILFMGNDIEIKTESIGANIRRLRKERNMSQDELARKAFTNRSNINRYESGKMVPSADTTEKIEEALGVPAGTLAQKVAIAIPDTSALLRNIRLINLLLENYSQVIIPDVVCHELSSYKNIKKSYNMSPQDRRNRKNASQIMSVIEEYEAQHKGRLVRKDTRHYDVMPIPNVSDSDQKIVELAKDVRKQTSRLVDIIHVDKDFSLLVDDTVNALYLEQYMANRSKTGNNYQSILDFDLEYDYLERYDIAAKSMDLNAYLPDGMTLLISCIRCNEPEKVEERGGRVIPEAKIQKKMKFLLEHGADPDKTDCHQYHHTPLEHCIERHNPDIHEFYILLDYGADYNKGSVDETQPADTQKRLSEINEGNTPLMIACWLGKKQYVKKLCSMPDICINSQDCNGFTPLMKCAVSRWNRKNKGFQIFDYTYNAQIISVH